MLSGNSDFLTVIYDCRHAFSYFLSHSAEHLHLLQESKIFFVLNLNRVHLYYSISRQAAMDAYYMHYFSNSTPFEAKDRRLRGCMRTQLKGLKINSSSFYRSTRNHLLIYPCLSIYLLIHLSGLVVHVFFFI